MEINQCDGCRVTIPNLYCAISYYYKLLGTQEKEKICKCFDCIVKTTCQDTCIDTQNLIRDLSNRVALIKGIKKK